MIFFFLCMMNICCCGEMLEGNLIPSGGSKRHLSRIGPQSVQRNGPYQVVSNSKVNGVVLRRPHTLDSLFANMKEQRMRVQAQAGWRPRNYAPQQRKFYGRQRNFAGRQRLYGPSEI